MSDQPIFLIRGTERVVLHSRDYVNEGVLQSLLANHPAVLAGGTTAGDGGQSLLLVHRELDIPAEEGGASVFNIDHLFIDSTGIPVFVEVKRAKDTRIRREVVGQMLDYVANGTRYWPVDQLQESLVSLQSELHPNADDPRSLADEAVREFGFDDVTEFWQTVELNLRQGKVRMVFVADALPDRLVRIIEFLNEQMSPAEVLGVEVVQYLSDDGTQVLVPRIIGATSTAIATKRVGHGYWDRDSFLEAASERSAPEVVEVFERLFEHVATCRGQLNWGKGITPGLSGCVPVGGEQRPVWLASLGTPGPNSHPTLTFWFSKLAAVEPGRVDAMVDTLSKIHSYRVAVNNARATGYKGKGSFPMIALDDLVASSSDVSILFEALSVMAGPGSPSTPDSTRVYAIETPSAGVS
jgi:hypothetical protein